jgi:hypothetical protein
MSAIRLPLVVELDYQKLEQLNDKFEESKKRLLNLAKLTKSGFAETCKQLGKVDKTLLNMQSSLTELNGQLLKSSLSSKDIFIGAIDNSIGLTASIAYLTREFQFFSKSMAGWAAIGTAAGIGLKAAFDAWSNSSLKAMSETAKVAHEHDRILDALKGAAKEGNTEAQRLLQTYSQYAKRIGDSELALNNFLSEEREHYRQIKEISNAYYQEKDAAKAAADTKKYLSLLFGDLINSSDELISKTGELSKTNADLYSVMDKYGVTSLTKLNDETKTLLSEYDLMQSHTTMNIAMTKGFASAVTSLIEQYRVLGKDAPQALRDLHQEHQQYMQLLKGQEANGESAIMQGAKSIEMVPPEITMDDVKYDYGYTLKELAEQAQQFRKKDLTGWKTWADGIVGLFGNIWSSIKGTYKQFETGFQDIGKSWSTGAEKGGFFGGLQASLPGIGSMIGLLTKVPEIIKQVWASIKDFARSIASLFGWMSEEEKVHKDVLRDLGATISDELAKKIADSSKEIGDRFTAVTLHLGDIMRETDITAKNFDTFASRARDVFSLLETGMMDATMATSTLNDVFPQLADEMDKLGITFNKNMIDMIQLRRTFGLEVQSIKQYVEEKLGIAVQGLTTATQNLGEIGQAEFDRLARAAAAAFQELMKNGTDIASAIDQMKEVIGNLGKAQEEYGLKGSAAFNQLKRYGNLVETNRSVIESVKGMTDVYTSLAQVGAMNQQLFNDWQTHSLANYDKLIAGGFKQNEALALMAPTLQSLKEAHEAMGYKIDDNTRALIEQADAAGLLKADPMIEMCDAVIEMKDAVYDLIDHISGHSPPCGSLIESFDTALEYTKSYGRELINAFSPLPVENLISKLGEIPKDIGIHVGYTYDEYAGPYGGKYGGGYGYGGGTGPGGKSYYAAQHGGIFTVPTHLLVGENPAYNPEVVLNRFQLERLLHQSPTPARNLNDKEGKPVVIVNKLYLNGKEIAQCIKELSQDGLLSIDERAIKT